MTQDHPSTFPTYHLRIIFSHQPSHMLLIDYLHSIHTFKTFSIFPLTSFQISFIIYFKYPNTHIFIFNISQIFLVPSFPTFNHYKEVLNIYTKILSKYHEIETQIQSVKKQIKHLPSGTLWCARNGEHYKWYQHNNHTNAYIPKKQRQLAEQLALKKYLCLLLEELTQEKLALQLYLQQHSDFSKSKQLFLHPEFQKLLSPAFTPISQELDDWRNATYDHNTNHPENLLHKSNSGHLVRSKSEAIIDMLLYIHKIPFRYECALHLGEITLFPDFTIRHPNTGATFYWEHFGMMDDPTYSRNAYSRLQLYTTHRIIPSLQLITTYETKENPLTPDSVERIIKQYFGD